MSFNMLYSIFFNTKYHKYTLHVMPDSLITMNTREELISMLNNNP